MIDRHRRRSAAVVAIGLVILASGTVYAGENGEPGAASSPLTLEEVLGSVRTQYPPYLAALIETDIASGRLRTAQGAFDLNLNASGTFRPVAYYDGTTASAVLEQGLPFWGGSVYGGYLYSDGFLPDYNKDRAQGSGEVALGLRLNLLRDGTIDKRRAALAKAQLDRALADPIVLKQHIEFLRNASIAYFNWVGAGQALALAEAQLKIAEDRDRNVRDLVKEGAAAPIIIVDNERLVASRSIAVVKARRLFEKTAIELSLFLRDPNDDPVVQGRERLPPGFPATSRPDKGRLDSDIESALQRRPEARAIRLKIEKAEIDLRLAKNELLPNVDVGIEANQAVSDRRTYDDIDDFELAGRVEVKIPLQRREARGRVQAAEGALQQLLAEEEMARNKITADVQGAYVNLDASALQITQARRNVDLAQQLQDAEYDRLESGATDLLPVQLREQAAFEAQVSEVQALADYFKALADYRAAVAADVPPPSDSQG